MKLHNLNISSLVSPCELPGLLVAVCVLGELLEILDEGVNVNILLTGLYTIYFVIESNFIRKDMV